MNNIRAFIRIFTLMLFGMVFPINCNGVCYHFEGFHFFVSMSHFSAQFQRITHVHDIILLLLCNVEANINMVYPNTHSFSVITVQQSIFLLVCLKFRTYVQLITHKKQSSLNPSILYYARVHILNWFATVLVWCIHQCVNVCAIDAFAFMFTLY